MKIQVKDVGEVVSKQGPKAAYSVFELIYKSGDKVYTKNIMEFNKDAFLALKDAQPGDWFDVETEKSKDGKYTNWTTVVTTTAEKPSGGTVSKGAFKVSGNSNEREFETAEERSNKQIYIVRQSSLTNALDFLRTTTSNDFAVDDVLETAKKFEAFVFGKIETPPELEVEVD